MALVLADRVKESCTAPGIGTVTLLGAATGYVSFAVIGNGNTTYYCIADQGGNNWEVGIGTYTSSGTTLSRDTVLSNSAGTTALINFSSGTQDVFVTYPSERSVYTDGAVLKSDTAGVIANKTLITTPGYINANENGFSVGPVTIGTGGSVTVAAGQRWLVV